MEVPNEETVSQILEKVDNQNSSALDKGTEYNQDHEVGNVPKPELSTKNEANILNSKEEIIEFKTLKVPYEETVCDPAVVPETTVVVPETTVDNKNLEVENKKASQT